MAKNIQNPSPAILSKIKDIEKYEADLIRPKSFDSRDPADCIIDIDRQFQNVVTALEDFGIFRPQKLTVFLFLSKLRYFKKKFKQKK